MSNEEIEERRDFMDQLLTMIANSDGCPIEYKVLKADHDFNSKLHNLMQKKGFRSLEDTYMLSLISFYEQGMELLDDLDKKIKN